MLRGRNPGLPGWLRHLLLAEGWPATMSDDPTRPADGAATADARIAEIRERVRHCRGAIEGVAHTFAHEDIPYLLVRIDALTAERDDRDAHIDRLCAREHDLLTKRDDLAARLAVAEGREARWREALMHRLAVTDLDADCEDCRVIVDLIDGKATATERQGGGMIELVRAMADFRLFGQHYRACYERMTMTGDACTCGFTDASDALDAANDAFGCALGARGAGAAPAPVDDLQIQLWGIARFVANTMMGAGPKLQERWRERARSLMGRPESLQAAIARIGWQESSQEGAS